MKTKEVGNFTLPQEKVTVKYIKRKKGMAANVADDHVISGGMLDTAIKKYYCPLKRTGGLANILTNEEKEYLERPNITGLNLSVYGEFWKTFCVRLHKDDASNVFDLSDPMSYISIKILESRKEKIAPSWDKRNHKQTYEYVITRENEEFKEKKVKLDYKKQAFKSFGKIEGDRDILISILKLINNKKVSSVSELEWVQGKVEDYLDSNPKKFLDILGDPSFETKVLIGKGVDAGTILKKGNRYQTVDGLDLCENGGVASFDNAVKYLNDDKNQEVRALIEARIDNAK